MCFNTQADIAQTVVASDVKIGDRVTISHKLVGSWRGSKTDIQPGTELHVINVMTTVNGSLRAMVETPEGDVQWVSANLLN